MVHLEAEVLENRLLLTAGPGPDDFGNTFADAADVKMLPLGLARLGGRLQYAGDADMFRFTAPHTGRLQIESQVQEGANFVSSLELYKDDGQSLVPERFLRNGKHTLLSFAVEEGRSYFVKAEAAPPSDPPAPTSDETLPTDTPPGEGDFMLFFGPEDDAGNSAADATPLEAASGQLTGQIEVPSDVDRFVLVPPSDGRLKVEKPSIRAEEGGILALLDASDNVVPPINGVDPMSGTGLEYNLAAGQVYYLEMRGPSMWPEEGFPEYDLTLTWTPTTPAGQPGGVRDTLSGGGGEDGLTGENPIGAPTGFLNFIDLNRFLAAGDPAAPTTGLLPLPESDLAIVGTLLGGAGPAVGPRSNPTALSGGAASPGDDLPNELKPDVDAMNYKMGVDEALTAQVNVTKQRWLDMGPDPSAGDESAGVYALADLQRFLSEELLRLSRPLSDTAMSLFQQITLTGQILKTDVPAETQEPAPGQEGPAHPIEPPTSRPEEKARRDSQSATRAVLALLLAMSTVQLWWTHRTRPARLPRPGEDKA